METFRFIPQDTHATPDHGLATCRARLVRLRQVSKPRGGPARRSGRGRAGQAREECADRSTRAFKCDGRTYCSQMTSCAEATFFLKNCPGTKMDGNHDGVPCEKQWCK